MYICVYTCKYTCIHTIQVHRCIYTYIHTHIYVYMHRYICTYIFTHAHRYVYVHIYVYMHTHIYIHMSPGADLARRSNAHISLSTSHMFSGAGSSQLRGRCKCVLFSLIKQVETAGEFSSEPTASRTVNAWLAVDTRTCFSAA